MTMPPNCGIFGPLECQQRFGTTLLRTPMTNITSSCSTARWWMICWFRRATRPDLVYPREYPRNLLLSYQTTWHTERISFCICNACDLNVSPTNGSEFFLLEIVYPGGMDHALFVCLFFFSIDVFIFVPLYLKVPAHAPPVTSISGWYSRHHGDVAVRSKKFSYYNKKTFLFSL